MEFNIRLGSADVDAAALARDLQDIDPAGIADFDPASGVLRISASLSDLELSALLLASGHPLDPSRIERLPSVCCGGCGG